jgi:hypothetical protein
VGSLLAHVLFYTLEIAGVVGYADVDLKWEKGAVTVQRVRPGRFAKPTAIRRYRGRFTAIVARGKTNLVELQFDFPLLAAAESDDVTTEARQVAARLRDGVTSTTTIRVPFPDGADTIVIYDGLTTKDFRAPLVAKAAPPPAR